MDHQIGDRAEQQLIVQLEPDAAQNAPDQGREQGDAHSVDDLAEHALDPLHILALGDAVAEAADSDDEPDHGADQAQKDERVGDIADDLDRGHQTDP